ncbi:VOC family protein [Georgenia deserti]|uniref:VOC family protein n=1 Tax=Georgenia deserti TaxID=2093781 RepID=A0ABW4L3B2_9MICO
MHTVLDAADARGLAEFYRQLLGLRYRPGDEPPSAGEHDLDWLVLVDDHGTRRLAVQRVPELPRSTWPGTDVPAQAHVDFLVDSTAELVRHRDRARALGAEILLDRSTDPDEPLYVLADPAGHPFCLLAQPGT